MKPITITILIPAIFLFLAAVVFAAQGDSYANCDKPFEKYKCYDPKETPYCPGQGLEYVKGWCSDPPGRVTRCCVPPGTPEGKRTGGPGLRVAPQEKPRNLVNQDFELLLEGTLSCEYTVTSSGELTKKTKFPCDEYVKITVGPKGDCRHEGKDTCVITNDGGYLGFQKVYTLSVEFAKPNVKTYGACRKYTSSQCVEETACKGDGGTPISRYCPGKPKNIKCCLYQVTEAQPADKFIFDKTKDKVLRVSEIDNQLRLLKEKHNVRIIIEVVDELPQSTEQNLRKKFDSTYKLNDESTTGMDMVLMYGRAKNAWRAFGFRGCTVNEVLLRQIISEDIVSKNLKEQNYDEGFKNFVALLDGAISRKIKAGDICKDSEATEACAKVCGTFATLENIFIDCKDACQKTKGCLWNGKNCEHFDDSKISTCFDIGANENLCKNKALLDSKGLSCMWDFKGCVPKFRVEKILIDYGRTKAVACGRDINGDVTSLESVLTYAKRTPDEKGILQTSLPRGTVMKIQRWVGGYDSKGNFRDGATSPLYTNTMVPWGKEDVIKNPKDGQQLRPKYSNAYGAAYAHLVTAKVQNIEGIGTVRAGVSLAKQLHGTEGPVLDDFFDDTYNRYCPILKPLRNFRLVYRLGNEVKDLWQYIVDEKLDIYTTDSSNTASHGCLRVTNRFILWLEKNAPIGTPIFYIDSGEGDSPNCEEYRLSANAQDEIRIVDSDLVTQLEQAIKTKYPNNAEAKEWATEIVSRAKYKKAEYVTLIASFIDQESHGFPEENEFFRWKKVNDFFSSVGHKFLDAIGQEDQNPSLGCMNLKLCKALETVNFQENKNTVIDKIQTRDGCLFYGNKYIEKITDIYAPKGSFDESSLLLISADFAAAPFSSRNAAVQKQLSDLTGKTIDLDGDMLAYDSKCPASPKPETGETELLVRDFILVRKLQMTPAQIREELKLEKSMAFERTTIYKEIKKAWKEKFGRGPDYAVISNAQTYVTRSISPGAGSSLGYAKRTKEYYNAYCSELSCQRPAQIVADAESAALLQPVA